MPRRVKVDTKEMGLIDLYLIYERDGQWEAEWRPLQSAKGLVSQLPTIDKEQMEHAYIGWTRPLVNALGPPPNGMLLTIPTVTRECSSRNGCPFYRSADCSSMSKKMPWCYVPEGFAEAERTLAAECVRLWRDGVYIVVVKEPTDAR